MEKEIKFFKENDDCPTCEQPITEHFKEGAIVKRTDKMITNSCALISMDEQITEMDAREKLYNKITEIEKIMPHMIKTNDYYKAL